MKQALLRIGSALLIGSVVGICLGLGGLPGEAIAVIVVAAALVSDRYTRKLIAYYGAPVPMPREG